MRVLLTLAEMGPGGAERMAAELASGLGSAGDSVALAADRGPFDSLLDGSGVERHVMPGRGRSPVRVARAALIGRRVIRSFAPDIIHAHNVKATGISAVSRRLAPATRSPLLAAFQGVHPEEYRGAARVLRLADAVVCVSQDLAVGLADHGLPAERIRVIPNAVRVPEPLSDEARRALELELGLDGRSVVSMVGRLVPQKAPERFIEAAARIASVVPNCRFLVVGDGPLRERLETLTRRKGLEQSVLFTGLRSDARDLIACSDAIVFSSEWEGMAVAALEALAAGVPVIATDVEGMGELLAGGAGLVVPRDPAALAEATIRLLQDPVRRTEMGRSGTAKIAAEFSVERMVGAYREVYGELLAATN